MGGVNIPFQVRVFQRTQTSMIVGKCWIVNTQLHQFSFGMQFFELSGNALAVLITIVCLSVCLSANGGGDSVGVAFDSQYCVGGDEMKNNLKQ